MQYNGYRDLKVYQLAYKLAMEIFDTYFTNSYNEVNRMLYSMIDKPEKFSTQKVKSR